MPFTRRNFCAMTIFGLAFSDAVHAQEWPAKQAIRIIVPYPAGGNADSAARALAAGISGNLKQTVIVDNRSGASSIIGTAVVAKAPADGYTIGLVSDSHAINQVMARLPKGAEILGTKVPYDALHDFVPVAGAILIPLVLAVNSNMPARNLKEVVALSKNKESGLNFGTMGPGSPYFIHMHQIADATGGVFVDVSYKGLAPATSDLIGGQIDTMVMPVHYAQQYIRAGKLIPLATLGAQRHPLLPDVPTLAESGYPGLDISNYLFFVAPAGTPQAIVDRLGKELNTVLKTPEMKVQLAASGDPYPAEPAELTARLRRDIETYGKVIQNVLR